MKRAVVLAIITIVLAAASSGFAERIIYIDGDAPGANDGSSWKNAYNFLQDALADAGSGEKPAEIRVAQGVHHPDRSTDKPNGSGKEHVSFELINEVALRGGYAGFGHNNPDLRDIKKYESILSGDLKENDIEVNDPSNLMDGPTRRDNSSSVLTSIGCNRTAILDGFIITAGRCDSICEIALCGGGGLYNYQASPSIFNCKFFRNSAYQIGGAIYNGEYCSPSVVNCVFEDNFANYGGGALADWSSNVNAKLINCTFVGNSGSEGGAILSVGNITLGNCMFAGNTAEHGKAISSGIGVLKATNCILWDGGNEIYDPLENAKVSYSNVQDGWPGEGNININPLFADPDNNDYHLKSQAGRWNPSSASWVRDDVTSPCIDAGDPISPIGHSYNPTSEIATTTCGGLAMTSEPFPNGGIVNMGAYGGTAEASKSWFGGPVCETIVSGDINGDCKVDFQDFAFMAIHWLEEPGQ